MGVTILTAPTAEPVSLEEARDQLIEIRDARNEEILRKIATARQYVETTCGIALMPQVWRLTLDAFPCDRLVQLPGGHVRGVTEVSARGADGMFAVVPSLDYDVDLAARPPRIHPVVAWPATPTARIASVRVDYQVGYATAAAIPRPLIEAMLLLVVDALENRQAQQAEALNMNPALDAYLRPYRSIVP